ncbi:MAG: RidA family protein [Acidobacteria bacterium]|nr:RidA family protein [Acidobacteriota bacterium]
MLALGVATDVYSQKPGVRHLKRDTGGTSTLPFSDAVMAGNTMYLAGRLGVDAKTGRIPDDLDAEIHNALDSMKSTLEGNGMSMDDLVTVTVYCPDLTLYDKFNGIYKSYFKKDFPARAFIGSGPLLRGGHFEIQAIAVKP